MSKVIEQHQNNGKALEVRLEQRDLKTYYVVIAGMTVNLRSGCVRGVCEPVGEEEFMYVENETYTCKEFDNYNSAKQTFDDYKNQYIG